MKANFHTHTYRCGHAVGTEREYIEEAIKGGFNMIGIADHTPWPRVNGWRYGTGMEVELLDGYVESLRALREEYTPQISVKIALECEFFPMHMSWLKDTIAEKHLDYVILGNHFDGRNMDEEVWFGAVKDDASALTYMKRTIEGMQTGVYAYLAHPELFLRAMPEWNRTMADISRELCRTANDMHMPIEYNLEGVRSKRLGSQSGIGYPNRLFWDIAASEGCTAIIGVDAHYPKALSDPTDFDAAKKLLDDELGMKRIDSLFEA